MWARLEEAMGLEVKEGKIPNAYNMCFYATMCHVCKGFGDGVLLKRCGGCRMISYCGQEHQKQHWELHKPLCKAIQDVLRDHSIDNPIITVSSSGVTLENQKKKHCFMLLLSNKLGRRLNAGEIQMLNFQRECLVCHERNAQSLKDCQKCVASFCKNHVNGTEHKNFCAPLELRFRSDLLAIRGEVSFPDMRYLQHVTDKGKFQNMKDFINTYWNIPTDSEMSRNILMGQHSLHLTRPLTLFHAMRLLNYVPKSKAIVIHVVGACCLEEFSLMGWEVFPRLIGTAMPVTIIMIGPNLQRNIHLQLVCDIRMFLSENENLKFDFYDMSYEKYVRSSSFVKPDLVVGFDQVIQEHELGSSKETWAPSIQLIAKQNCPFILTWRYSLQSFKKELDRINTILGRKVNYLYSGKNPFASLSPFRNVAPEYVLYLNQYIVIYRSLCL